MLETKALSRETVARQLCDIIAASRPKLAGKIQLDTQLTPELGIDSLAMMESVIEIEERFSIVMPDFEEFDAGRIFTVEDLVDIVMERLPADRR
jgi:acyl carrier protein